MKILGLTGSIGMGKSTVAQMFVAEGAALWNADAAVHRLYAKDGAGVRAIAELATNAVTDGAVDRAALRREILSDPSLLKRVEAVIHPLVAQDRADAIAAARASGADVIVLDIPLIFETGAAGSFDAVIVVSAPPDVQRARVLDRPGMTEEAFEAILAKQVPDAEKRAKADFVIDTNVALEDTAAQVREVLNQIRKAASDA